MNTECIFLPTYKVGLDEISDGEIIKLCEYCKKNKSEKCENFYREIFNSEGLHICPYGFNTYVIKDESNIDIFTGFRVKDKYNAQKANPKVTKFDDNKVITENEMNIYIETYKKMCRIKSEYRRNADFLGNMVHDIRKFNANIKGKSELLTNKSHNKTKKDREKILEYSRNIEAMSQYISIKLKEYDYLCADSPWKSGEIVDFNFYKSFDKIRRCLQTEAKKEEKNITVSSRTNCNEVRAYSNIDTVPFLIIDNALKYSFNRSNIEVLINEEDTKQIIEIKSYGFFVDHEEIPMLFARGYRGKAATNSNKKGSGIGLYLIKQLCDANSIKVVIKTEKVLNINKISKKPIDEGYFKVILYINKE